MVTVLDIKKANGEIRYKAMTRRPITEGKECTQILGVASVATHKKKPTLNKEKVTIGKKNVPDFDFLTFSEIFEDVNHQLAELTKCHKCHTVPENPGIQHQKKGLKTSATPSTHVIWMRFSSPMMLQMLWCPFIPIQKSSATMKLQLRSWQLILASFLSKRGRSLSWMLPRNDY